MTEPNYAAIGPWSPTPEYAVSTCTYWDPGKQNILHFGDSIRQGAFPVFRSLMNGYNVFLTPSNAAYSGYAKLHVNEWLGALKHGSPLSYAAIVFNVGVWDLNSPEIPVTSYAANLRYIAEAIRAKTPCPLFVTTTAHPNFLGKKLLMRDAAREIMADLDIPIHDLEVMTSTPEMEALKATDKVHYTSAGYSAFEPSTANRVASLLGI